MTDIHSDSERAAAPAAAAAALAALGVPEALLQAVRLLDYPALTPIQAASLPPILAGRDVIGQARTGSGKTLAFGLGLLAALDATRSQVQALVLCPTRELADQVAKALRSYARFVPNVKILSLCGGIPLRPQQASLKHPPHIVVGTPGRIEELLGLQALELSGLRTLVLDEADRMLDMGFEQAIAAILGQAPKQRQSLLYSATFPDEIRKISKRALRDPVEVTVATADDASSTEQWFYEVPASAKVDALAALLLAHKPESALVFCNMRRDTELVAAELQRRGFAALALHGDLEQRERDEILVRFANRSSSVLVATDLAARGLDIAALPAVISHDLASDPDTHLHRIGRTGRAGLSGLALALCAPEETPRALAIEARQGQPLRWNRLDLGDRRRQLPPRPAMATLVIDAGRQDKLRPGDVVGALTGSGGLAATQIGKIDGFATRTYVAVAREQRDRAIERLRAGRIKGRSFRVRPLD